jgi:hypothetical protein
MLTTRTLPLHALANFYTSLVIIKQRANEPHTDRASP